MSEYYGVTTPTDDFLAHYGVKGMKWGVRKAIAKGDKEALSEAFTNAARELQRRKDKANLLNKPKNKRDARDIIGSSLGVAATGGAMVGVNRWSIKNTGYHYPLANALGVGSVGIGAIGAALGAGSLISDTKASRAKGHAKAVKKVQEWDSAMREAFKGTEYAQFTKGPKYEDKYSLVKTTGYNKKTGKPIEKTVASISGSHLVKNYKGSDKAAFLKKAHDNAETLAMRSPDNTDTNANYYFKDLYKNTRNNIVVHPVIPKVPEKKKRR